MSGAYPDWLRWKKTRATPKPPGELFDAREAMEFLGVDQNELQTLVARGDVRVFRSAGMMKFRHDDLELARAEIARGELEGRAPRLPVCTEVCEYEVRWASLDENGSQCRLARGHVRCLEEMLAGARKNLRAFEDACRHEWNSKGDCGICGKEGF